MELQKQEMDLCVSSIQRYLNEEFELDVSEMKAKFLLNYIVKEIAPIAYNKGVRDAEMFFRNKIEDLTGSCFEPELTYWDKKK